MPTYTTKTKMGYWLPGTLPASITDEVKDQAISDAGTEIDARLTRFGMAYKSNTQKFPDVTDSPATPLLIDQIAQMLAAYYIYIQLKEINANVDSKQGFLLKDIARKRLQEINDGEINIYLSNGTQITRSSTHIKDIKEGTEPRIRKTRFDVNGTKLDSHYGSLSDFDDFESFIDGTERRT